MKKLMFLLLLVFGLILSSCSSNNQKPEQSNDTPTQTKEPDSKEPDQKDPDPQTNQGNKIPEGFEHLNPEYLDYPTEKTSSDYLKKMSVHIQDSDSLDHPIRAIYRQFLMTTLAGKNPRTQFDLYQAYNDNTEFGLDMPTHLNHIELIYHDNYGKPELVEPETLLKKMDKGLQVLDAFTPLSIEDLQRSFKLARKAANDKKGYNSSEYIGDFTNPDDIIPFHITITGQAGKFPKTLVPEYTGEQAGIKLNYKEPESNKLELFLNVAGLLHDQTLKTIEHNTMNNMSLKTEYQNNFHTILNVFRGKPEDTYSLLEYTLFYNGLDKTTLEEDQKHAQKFFDHFIKLIPQNVINETEKKNLNNLFITGLQSDVEHQTLEVIQKPNPNVTFNIAKNMLENSLQIYFSAWVDDNGNVIANPIKK